MAKYSFSQTQADYVARWAAMEIVPARRTAIDAAARKIMAGRAHYEAVSTATGVPWAFIGVLHYRESACDFRGVLHNGEKILGTGRKTNLVPKGRGPFTNWEEAARDALAIKGFKPGAMVWSLERCLYEGERFNGFGYRMRGMPSAYLWSGSDQYARGKYVADGKWSATAVDGQIGIAPLMRRLMELDGRVSFASASASAGRVMPDHGLSSDEVRALQQRLRDLGYSETGLVDGLWGPRTMAGIAAFQATVNLPVTGMPDAQTMARLSTAGTRPLGAARSSLTARGLRAQGDDIAKAAFGTRVAAVALGGPAVVVGILDQIQDAGARLSFLRDLGAIPGWCMAAGVLLVAIALFMLARRGESARLEAVQSGRDAGLA